MYFGIIEGLVTSLSQASNWLGMRSGLIALYLQPSIILSTIPWFQGWRPKAYRIYSNKRHGAYLIFRGTSAAVIRGRRLFKNCTRRIYLFYIFIQRYTFYLLIFLWTDPKLMVNIKLREKFTRWKNANANENENISSERELLYRCGTIWKSHFVTCVPA